MLYSAINRVIQQNSPATLLLSTVSNARFWPKYSTNVLPAPESSIPNASNRALHRSPTSARPNAIPYNPPINTPLY
jgi:hypothetical protein